MKTKECITKGIRIAELGLRKFTSYDMVKGRLSRGLYSDEFLQNRLKYENESKKLMETK